MKKSGSYRGKEALDGYTAENNPFTLHTTAAGNTGVHAGFTGAFRLAARAVISLYAYRIRAFKPALFKKRKAGKMLLSDQALSGLC